MSAATKIPARMTVDEFLAWADATPGKWELVDGYPRAITPPLRTHGTLQAELAYRLLRHFDDTNNPCVVVTEAGIVPRMFADHNFRSPDLAVTCTEYVTEERAITDPVLIVEILSPSNQADTWANIWTYTTIPSVLEILVLRADRIGAELLSRQPGGGWPAASTKVEGLHLVLESLEFSVTLAELYRRTRFATASPTR